MLALHPVAKLDAALQPAKTAKRTAETRSPKRAPVTHKHRACGPLAHFQPTPAFLPDSSPDRLTTVQLSSSAACTCQISLSLVSLVPPSSQTVGDSQLRQMPFPFGCRALQLLQAFSGRLHFFAWVSDPTARLAPCVSRGKDSKNPPVLARNFNTPLTPPHHAFSNPPSWG